MKALVAAVLLGSVFSITGFARDFADPASTTSALQFLRREKALAISGEDMFFDGGSLSFTFVADDGYKMVLVLSAESQRVEEKKFLSIYTNRRIWLLPDCSYDEASVLLQERIAAGLSSGLQQKWPAFTADADMLCSLLKEGGHAKDLDGFYTNAVERRKKGKKPNQSARPTSRGSGLSPF